MAKEAKWNPTLMDLLKEPQARISLLHFELSSNLALGEIYLSLGMGDGTRTYKLSIQGLERALKAGVEYAEKEERQYQ